MIISLGEGLIDFISRSDLDFSGYPGGSPFNSSVAIARQGVPCQYLGRLSTDIFGNRLIEHLKENNVGTDLVIRSDDSSTMSFVQKQKDGSAKYAFFANATADRNWDEADLINLKIPEECRIIHFGSISISQEPCGTVLTDFLTSRCSDYLLSFDPNIRPSLIENREAYMKRFESLCRICSIVKLSDEDLEWLYPGETLDTGLAKILKQGTAMIALTEGKKGARLITTGHEARSPLFDLPVSDTIGAGDTFHGAMLCYLHKKGIFSKEQIAVLGDEELLMMGNFANKAAGINCSRSGANPPTSEEMERIEL